MIRPKLLLAYQSQTDSPQLQQLFFAIAQHFDALFLPILWDMAEQAEPTTTDSQAEGFSAYLSSGHLDLDLPGFQMSDRIETADYYFPDLETDQASPLLALTKPLHQLYLSTRPNPLDHLPLRASLYDPSGLEIYSNGRYDGSFEPKSDQAQQLEDWLVKDCLAQADKPVYLHLPSQAFDQILVQSYQALYDHAGTCQGILETYQDLRPLLASYLKETGQALVGWSDTTSGASISSGDFDDDY